jgi:hypothetical protein
MLRHTGWDDYVMISAMVLVSLHSSLFFYCNQHKMLDQARTVPHTDSSDRYHDLCGVVTESTIMQSEST